MILGLPMNTLAFVYDGLFKGLGEMKYLRNVLLAATFLGFIPALYLGKALGWGFYAIWIAFAVWMAIRGFSLGLEIQEKIQALGTKPVILS